MYDDNLAGHGYVWNNSRVWGHQPGLYEQFGKLLTASTEAAGLTNRERAVLVIGQAAAIGDSYCSVAWGRWLTEWEDAPTALAAVTGDETPFDDRERALLAWARLVARDPNGSTEADLQRLREAGFDDAQIFALTLFAALRLAMSSTNDVLGARPDLALAETIDPAVLSAISWGRRPA
jgi:alkylhydroperoxidase family enzyme